MPGVAGTGAADPAGGPARRPLPGLGFLLALQRLNLMAGMAYRWSFLSQVVFMMLNNAIFMVFWWVFFQRFPQVQGWGMDDMLLLFALVAAGFGLSVTLFGNALRLSSMIQEGKVDVFLSAPPDPFLHLLMSRMSLSGIGDFLFGVGAFLWLYPADPVRWLAFGVVVVCSGLILTAFWVISQCLAFFLGGSEGISGILAEALVTLSMYPDSLFTGGVKYFVYSVVPVGFVAWLPVSIVRGPGAGPLALLVAATVLWVWLARLVFAAGLRRYESGNLIQARG